MVIPVSHSTPSRSIIDCFTINSAAVRVAGNTRQGFEVVGRTSSSSASSSSMSRIAVSSTSLRSLSPSLPASSRHSHPRRLNPAGVPRQREQVRSEARCTQWGALRLRCGVHVHERWTMNEYVPFVVTPSRSMRLSSLSSAVIVAPSSRTGGCGF